MVTQRWPTSWLFTDERLGPRLHEAMRRAAESGAGIIVRHHRSSLHEQRELLKHARALGATVGVARNVELARRGEADLVHNPQGETERLPFSLSVHTADEARAAAQRPAAMVFVSPVFPTRSHPRSPVLDEERALELASLAKHPAYALGGMDAQRGAALMQQGFSGWAGIDCWLRT